MADETLVLRLDIGADSEEAQQALSELAQRVQALDEAFAQAARPVADLEETSRQASEAMEGLGGAAGEGAEGLGRVAETAEVAHEGVGRAGQQAEEASGVFGLLGEAAHRAGEAVAEMGEGLGLLSQVASSARTGLEELFRGLQEGAEGALLGVTGLVTAGVGGFALMGKATVDWANEMMRLQAVTGMTKDETEKWKIAMDIAGLGASGLERTAFRLEAALGQAREEMERGEKQSAATAALVRVLGEEFFSAGNYTADLSQVLPQVIEGLAGIEDPAQRAALASDIFGRRFAVGLLPLLEHYNEIMPEAIRQTEAYGEGMEDPARAAIEFNARLNELGEQMEEVYTQVGPAFLAALTGLGKGMEEVVGKGEEVVSYLKEHREVALALASAVGLTLIPSLARLAASLAELAVQGMASRGALVGLLAALALGATVGAAMDQQARSTRAYSQALGELGEAAQSGGDVMDALTEAMVRVRQEMEEGQRQADEYNSIFGHRLPGALRRVNEAMAEVGQGMFGFLGLFQDRAYTTADVMAAFEGRIKAFAQTAQQMGLTWQQAMAVLERAGIDTSQKVVQEALEPLRQASERAMQAMAKQTHDAVVSIDGYFDQLKKGLDVVSQGWEKLLPRAGETFQEWKKEIDQFLKNAQDFEKNLQAVMQGLAQAHVQNVDQIVAYIAQRGPDYAAQVAQYFRDSPREAMETFAQLAPYLGSGWAEEATKRVLAQGPGYERAVREAVIDHLYKVPREVETLFKALGTESVERAADYVLAQLGRLPREVSIDVAVNAATAIAQIGAIEAAFQRLRAEGYQGPYDVVGGFARQLGGPVVPGLPFLVGEAGPELFVPREPGYILPHDLVRRLTASPSYPAREARGGPTVTVTIHSLTVQAETREGGRAAARAFYDELRKRGIVP